MQRQQLVGGARARAHWREAVGVRGVLEGVRAQEPPQRPLQGPHGREALRLPGLRKGGRENGRGNSSADLLTPQVVGAT